MASAKWLLWLCACIRILSVYCETAANETDAYCSKDTAWGETSWYQLSRGTSRQRKMCSKWNCQTVPWLTAAFLLCYGDVEPNPGPPTKSPCGQCNKAVKRNDEGILCDGCELWYHCTCAYVDTIEYQRLGSSDDPRYCPGCVLPPFSDSYFGTSCSNHFGDSAIDEMDNVALPFLEHVNRLVFCHLNIRSLLPNVHQLQVLLQQCKQQSLVLGISESWLDDTITDAEIVLPGHDVHRRDRNRRGSGVLVYVNHHVCCKRRMHLESDEIEAIWLEIKVRKHPILVCNVYRPPSSALPYWTVLGNMLKSAASEG